MNQTIKAFKKIQEENLGKLKKLYNFVKGGEEFDIEIDDIFIKKLENAIKLHENEKLKVALIGGFSEGKTSIAAAWMEKLDKANMKINHQESSDEVQVFDIDDDIELIDTPGLFGFKSKINNQNKVEQYKDITKKYVSEAHIILYVLNPSNPIKDSHKEDLIWLFRTLNLLPRTIFVLSRFDEIADVEDEDDYNKQFSIKKENIINRLDELISLKAEEKKSLSIVAVCANPFDEGLDYWLLHKDEFKKLSHIENLQNETQRKINENGGKISIIEESKNTILNDILAKQLPVIKQSNTEISKSIEQLQKSALTLQEEIISINQELSKSRIELREFIVDYFSNLCLKLNGTSMETFSKFFERDVGESGYIIDNKIKNEFEKHTNKITNEVLRIETNFNNEVSFLEKNITTLGKHGVNFLRKSNVINATNIKLARDIITKGARYVGFDIGLKFKPWGAVNLASKLNIALTVVGVVIEIVDIAKKKQEEQKFINSKMEINNEFNSRREELLALINDEISFKNNYFPNLVILENALKEVNENFILAKSYQTNFQKWLNDANEIIDIEAIN